MRIIGDLVGVFREPPGSSKTYGETYYIVRWFTWSNSGMKYLAIGRMKFGSFYPIAYFHDIINQRDTAKEVYECS